VRCVLRYNGEKIQLSQDGLVQSLTELLEKIQNNMYQNAVNRLNEKKKTATTWEEFMTELNKKNVVLTPWCKDKHCEEKVKERSGIETKEGLFDAEHSLTGAAKTLCMPL
jgi:prolyl-tRNA synthetase